MNITSENKIPKNDIDW